jgi:hypothetical protein
MYNKIIRSKQFKLPLEEQLLNRVYNNQYVTILDEKVFQDKTGDVVVYLKYEELEVPKSDNEEDELFD